MAKKIEKKENLICGKTEEEIRKAFFKNKLGEFMAEIQIDKSIDKKELNKLNNYLLVIQDENKNIVDEAVKLFGGKVVGVELKNKPPTVEELRSGDSDKEWREKADSAIAYFQLILDKIRAKRKTGERIEERYWLEESFTILSYEDLIDKDRVFKDQLYRARLTEILDKYGISRKEAEERAKLTKEYAEYKNAVLLKERIVEFIYLSKKKDGHGNYN